MCADKFVLFSFTWFGRQLRCLGELSSDEFLRLKWVFNWDIFNFILLASDRYESLMPRRYQGDSCEVYFLGYDIESFSEIELKDLPLFLGWSYRTSRFAKIFKELL